MALNQLRSLTGRARGRATSAWIDRADRRFTPQATYVADAPTVILAPHPDDAVFNCWSVLTGEGTVRVVNLFAGVPDPGKLTWWDRICGASDSAAQAQARLDEDRALLEPLVGPPINLPLLERQYRSIARLPVAALGTRLLRSMGAASAVYAPAALGTAHADHRLTRSLGQALARAGIPVQLYADVPYAVRHGWPDWVTGVRGEQGSDVDRDWEASLAAVPEIGALRDARVVRLSPDAAARKLGAMKGYRTQFPALDEDGLLSDSLTHGHELFWSLRVVPGGQADAARTGRPVYETCGLS